MKYIRKGILKVSKKEPKIQEKYRNANRYKEDTGKAINKERHKNNDR